MQRYNFRINLEVVSFLLIGFFFPFAQEHHSNQEQTSKLYLKTETQSQDAKFKIETIVTLFKGITEEDFDLKNKKLSVIYDPKEIQEDMIQLAVQSLAYVATKCNEKESRSVKAKSTDYRKESTVR